MIRLSLGRLLTFLHNLVTRLEVAQTRTQSIEPWTLGIRKRRNRLPSSSVHAKQYGGQDSHHRESRCASASQQHTATDPPLFFALAIQAQDRVSDRAKKTLDIVAKFVEEECMPSVSLPLNPLLPNCRAHT